MPAMIPTAPQMRNGHRPCSPGMAASTIGQVGLRRRIDESNAEPDEHDAECPRSSGMLYGATAAIARPSRR